jgi:hypothetical protein
MTLPSSTLTFLKNNQNQMLKIQTRNLIGVFVLFTLTLLSACGSGITPEKILAKYAEATGENKLAKPKSIFFKAKVSQMPTTFDANFASAQNASKSAVRLTGMSVYCEFPNKVMMNSDAAVVAVHQMGERKVADVKVLQAYDGQTGWEIVSSPSGSEKPRQLMFYEVDKLKKIAESTFSSHLLSKVSRSKYIGEQTIKINIMLQGTGMLIDKKTHVIEAYSPEGKKQTLYFDVEEGLLWKIEEVDPLTNDKTSSTMSNYKQFGNIKMPSWIIMNKTSANNQANDSFVLTVEEFSFDAPEPAGAFVKPAL